MCLAAGLAWWVATTVIGHHAPFFAPIAAVVSLGLSLGARLRRSFELVAGVTVGIGIGDLIISGIGSGPWQISLVVVLAMSVAVLLNSGPIFSMQAGNSAVLVATLIPPGGSGGPDRMIDALVGGLVGIAVVAIIPTHPVRRARKDAASILGTASEVLQLVADGLVANDPDPIVKALQKARATQGAIDGLRSNLLGGREISRISPLYWNSRPRLERLMATADPIDNAMRNIRVLARRSLTLVRDDEILDPRLVAQVERLSKAVEVLEDMILRSRGSSLISRSSARPALGGEGTETGDSGERRPVLDGGVRPDSIAGRRPVAGRGHEANLVDRHSAAHRASSRLRAGSLTSAVSRSLSNSLYVCECMHML